MIVRATYHAHEPSEERDRQILDVAGFAARQWMDNRGRHLEFTAERQEEAGMLAITLRNLWGVTAEVISHE